MSGTGVDWAYLNDKLFGEDNARAALVAYRFVARELARTNTIPEAHDSVEARLKDTRGRLNKAQQVRASKLLDATIVLRNYALKPDARKENLDELCARVLVALGKD